MGEQTGTRLNHRSAACKFPSESIRKKQLLRPQGIKKSLNRHFRPDPFFGYVILTLILNACGLVIFWMLTGVRAYWDFLAGPAWGEVPEEIYLFGFTGFMWFLVIALLTGLIVGEHVSMVEEA